MINVLDALLFELTSSLDTLPGGTNLDEDAVLADALLFVQGNDLAGLVDGGLCSSAYVHRPPSLERPSQEGNKACAEVGIPPGDTHKRTNEF
jgi:hypothetical protein